MQADNDVLVIYAPIGDVDMTAPLFPPSRDAEVRACKNENAMREKYLVWQLLRMTVEKYLKLDFANLQFTKTANGQWICPDFYFSLSHTDGAVCVAVADSAVGVDIERVRNIREGMPKRVLTVDELKYMDSLPHEERGTFFFEAWVKKESAFKMTGAEALLPRQRDSLSSLAVSERVHVGGEEYLIGIASDAGTKYEILFLEEI